LSRRHPWIESVPDKPTLQADLKQAAPFLKWAGGKGQLLEQYTPLFPQKHPVRRYFEPFVGSGAVFFHLRKQDFAGEYFLYDVNPELIRVYFAVRDEPDALIEQLAQHRAQHDHDHYYDVRNLDRDPAWQEAASDVERAARMIYLNKTCFNGLWRVNSKGHFNVPMGRYKNPAILDEPRLRAASRALQDVKLALRDFRKIAEEAGEGDFVYFDPPYVPLNETSNFTSYAADDFREQDQRELADVFFTLHERGCRVMLSNSDSPLVHDLYEGVDPHVKLELVRARRAINTRADRRGAINEVVVLNY
jgi:DNA adenine methylase